MLYNVEITSKAQEDFDYIINYIITELKNPQAANNLIDDFIDTIDKLKIVAGSLKNLENVKFKAIGYKRINFQYHSYFMLYRVIDNTAIIDAVFHNLQDFESKIK